MAQPPVTMENMATPTTDRKGAGQVMEVAVGKGLVATAHAATVNYLDIME